MMTDSGSVGSWEILGLAEDSREEGSLRALVPCSWEFHLTVTVSSSITSSSPPSSLFSPSFLLNHPRDACRNLFLLCRDHL